MRIQQSRCPENDVQIEKDGMKCAEKVKVWLLWWFLMMKGMDSGAGSGPEPGTSLQRGNLRNETLALSLITVISWEIPPASRCTATHRARGLDHIRARDSSGVA